MTINVRSAKLDISRRSAVVEDEVLEDHTYPVVREDTTERCWSMNMMPLGEYITTTQ
jgi:hypothetical protein